MNTTGDWGEALGEKDEEDMEEGVDGEDMYRNSPVGVDLGLLPADDWFMGLMGGPSSAEAVRSNWSDKVSANSSSVPGPTCTTPFAFLDAFFKYTPAESNAAVVLGTIEGDSCMSAHAAVGVIGFDFH